MHWSAPTGRGVGMTALQCASSYCWTGRGHSAGDGTGCWHRALNQKLREPFGFSHPLVEKHFFCLSEVQVSSEQTQGFLHRAALSEVRSRAASTGPAGAALSPHCWASAILLSWQAEAAWLYPIPAILKGWKLKMTIPKIRQDVIRVSYALSFQIPTINYSTCL